MMELVQASLFIPLIIVAIVQMIKMALPTVTGWLTIIVAFIVGIVVALTDTHIGVQDITIAQGIVYALGAIGISTVFSKAGGGSAGDNQSKV